MKKLFLTASLLLSLAGAIQAQTILDEDFETGNTGSALQPVASGEGWSVVSSYNGENTNYTWHNYYSNPDGEGGGTINGACCAAVYGPFSVASSLDGAGPREEILLTPELDLNDTYQLSFIFRVSPVHSSQSSKYDLEVRVAIDGNLDDAETIFSLHNEKMLRESGVMDFPIPGWSPYTAQVDLSDYKGEKVKLAFVYKMYAETSNVVWLDDVSVKKFTPASGPVASLSANRYIFPEMYIGEKMYSDVITLTNTGRDGLKVTGVDLPSGFSVNRDFSDLTLDRYKAVSFQIAYNAGLTTAASGDVVLHTNGGDVKVAVSATKQIVPEGYQLETFESFNPPAGWLNNGWTWTEAAFEGDRSMNCSGGFGACTLRSPRLDLTDGGTLTFSYYNMYDDEEQYPYYDIGLQVSYDGGDNWTTKWVSDYQNGLNQLLTANVDLGYGNDMCYVRWYYPMVETDDEGAAPHSSFTLDRVLLPNVFGLGGAPTGAKIVAPANGSEDIYPRDVKLEWSPAQFAEGYKVYVGTNAACDDLVNGEDVGVALSYTIPVCEYSTTYRWKVVPYNAQGNGSGVSTWRFTTQPDASVSEFPYEQNFETSGTPAGWVQTPSQNYNRTWDVNTLYPYIVDGKSYGAFATVWLNAGDWNAVATQEFDLPADKNMCITFAWGDEHPASLVNDPTGLVKKENVTPNNGVSELTFDIFADGEWTTLTTISEKSFDGGDHKYWITEKVDLKDYKGKKVQFRWRHLSYSGQDDGGAIARVRLYENEDSKGAFNMSEWKAGKVNYEKAVNSGDIFTLLNEGNAPLKVADVKFNTPNFSSSLNAGDEIAVNDGKTFSLQFNALQNENTVNDVMTVEFEGGYTMELPVSGEALPEGTYYYSFEPNPLDYVWSDDFTMIDVDKGANYDFSSYWVHYSAGGTKCAFSVESDSKEDGLYGMMSPISGMYALVGASPVSSAANNWIIWKKMKATSGSKFEFYGRNLETLQSVLPDPKHQVTVLVSTTGNTNTADFTTAMRTTEMPHLNGDEWNHYEVDLSSYAGQEIYVALQHSTVSASNLAFFDDFCFHNFNVNNSGLNGVATDIADDAQVEVYNLSGMPVAKGLGMSTRDKLANGFYIVKVTDANGVSRAFSIAR